MPPLPSAKTGFLRRLANYTVGIAIGLSILGAVNLAKRNAAKRDAIRQQSLPVTPDPFPPRPGLDDSVAPSPAAAPNPGSANSYEQVPPATTPPASPSPNP